MQKEGYETSSMTDYLSWFPEKSETLPELAVIAEKDPESYVRDKAKKAIVKIQTPAGKTSPQ